MQQSAGTTAESMLAAELNEMSVSERNTLLEDIHGVDDITPEPEGFVAEHLHLMQEELNKIHPKLAYEQAQQLDEGYVAGRKLRLWFLRLERFEPAKAARRLVRFLEAKKSMFGTESLARPLYLSDLDNDTREYVDCGRHQILPERSRSGKLVSILCPRQEDPVTASLVDCVIKAFFYLFTTHAEQDEDTQKRGFVHVVFYPGKTMSSQLMDTHKRMGAIEEILPIRLTGIHLCAHSAFLKPVEYFMMSTLVKSTRIRVRFHHGTPMECQYSLMSFGVPLRNLSNGPVAQLNNTAHTKWISKQKVRDQVLKDGGVFVAIDVPRINDVLLGRGRNWQEHDGNLFMKQSLVAKLGEYKRVGRSQRVKLIDLVMDEVHGRDGRFLEHQRNGWFEVVPRRVVVAKITRTFKTMCTAQTKLQPRQEQESSFVESLGAGKRLRISLDRRRPDECGEGCI